MSTARKAIVCMLMLLVLTMPALTETFDSHPSPEVVTSIAKARDYRGQWHELPALGIGFYLPEGWYGMAFDSLLDGVTAFSGGKADDTVGLCVTLWDSAEDGDYNGQIGEAFLDYVVESLEENKTCLANVNGTEVALYRDEREDRINVLVLVPHSNRVICFAFRSDFPNAIEDDFALSIVGTMNAAGL